MKTGTNKTPWFVSEKGDIVRCLDCGQEGNALNNSMWERYPRMGAPGLRCRRCGASYDRIITIGK